ncbi:hypothetical protein I6F07_17295 [Ensifer sp. IC4062]|nr:hypothetical protein [Ensifer sp. IC4062]MCA1441937.1 hypothetical protein [Ensifer sp. IC4062]
MTRLFHPVIEHQASWIVVNPAQGCPKNCQYCFLRPWGQTVTAPTMIATVPETIEQLFTYPYLRPRTPICLLTHTDPFATSANRALLMELISSIRARSSTNPICFVTKCFIPPNIVDKLGEFNAPGSEIIAYLSYSGLTTEEEPGINHAKLKDNFTALSARGIPVVHYWRPLLPQNSTRAVMERVFEWVSKTARCSVATGLKLYPEMYQQVKDWPELDKQFEEAVRAEDVWPDQAINELQRLRTAHPSYSIYTDNSCALSLVLGEGDLGAVYGSRRCQLCSCPQNQRFTCATVRSAELDQSTIEIALAAAGVPMGAAQFKDEPGQRYIEINDHRMSTASVAFLRQTLRTVVRVTKTEGDTYWNSGSTGGTPLVLSGEAHTR